MARTRGRGNPRWSREETILALDLYNQLDGQIPPLEDDRVQALSKYLRELPDQGVLSKNESFRNPDGVVFKLNNIRSVATGKGFKHTSLTDRAVWKELGGDPKRVALLAKQIRDGVTVTLSHPDKDDDENDVDEEFEEGRLLTKLHKSRERNRGIRKKLLKSRLKRGRLCCDICAAKSPTSDAKLEDAIFEGHHIVPIAQSMTRQTRIKDMALLCANCHKLLHRIMSKEKKWFTLDEARTRFADF